MTDDQLTAAGRAWQKHMADGDHAGALSAMREILQPVPSSNQGGAGDAGTFVFDNGVRVTICGGGGGGGGGSGLREAVGEPVRVRWRLPRSVRKLPWR